MMIAKDAWSIVRQFVEPGLQALGDQKGTAEVWSALRVVEAALGIPPKLPRPKGWNAPSKDAVTKNVAVVQQEIAAKPAKPKKVTTKKVTKTTKVAKKTSKSKR